MVSTSFGVFNILNDCEYYGILWQLCNFEKELNSSLSAQRTNVFSIVSLIGNVNCLTNTAAIFQVFGSMTLRAMMFHFPLVHTAILKPVIREFFLSVCAKR